MSIKDLECVEQAAELLQMDQAALEKCLTKSTRNVMGKMKELNESRPTTSLNALIRTIYNDVFCELVEQFSSRLRPKSYKQDVSLSVLDIFGFEFYDKNDLIGSPSVGAKVVNSFEQFCINLTNEKLQEHFVDCVFTMEIAQYQQEGLKVTPDDFDFLPNSKTVNMLESTRDKGIIGILDDSSSNPANCKGDGKGEEKLLTNLNKHLSKPDKWTIKGVEVDNAFAMVKAKNMRGAPKDAWIGARGNYGFMVQHYAANVIYDVEEWCDKNADKITQLKYDTLCTSKIITAATPGRDKGQSRSLLAGFVEDRNPDPDKAPSSKGGRASKSTLASKFRQSLSDLMVELSKPTRCAFVRCLKPNTVKKPQRYEPGLILNQLQYTGMLDTLIIRKDGWPARPKHEEFYLRYKCLYPSENDAVGILTRVEQKTGWHVNKVGEKIDNVKGVKIFIGKERILMKDEVARRLEGDRVVMMTQHSLTVQSVWRACEYKKIYQKIRKEYTAIGAQVRIGVARAIAARNQEWTLAEAADEYNHNYREEAKVQEAEEAEERKIAAMEDDYMFHLLEGMREAQYKMEKETEISGARAMFDKAKRAYDDRVAQVNKDASELKAMEDTPATKANTGPSVVTLDRTSNHDMTGRKTNRAKFRVSFKR